MTLDNLMKRGKVMVNRCFVCKYDAESYNHILLWCPFVSKLWVMVFNLIGINWVKTRSVHDELLAWDGLNSSNHVNRLISLTIL